VLIRRISSISREPKPEPESGTQPYGPDSPCLALTPKFADLDMAYLAPVF